MSEKLVYVGKVIELHPIENADFILSATVVCGPGGKWRGVVKKEDFQIGSKCVVYLPDSLIPPSDDLKFMEKSNWRVKMQRFRGSPSEVLIMPYCGPKDTGFTGDDLTAIYGVTKYHKPVPAHLNGIAKGPFPSFIPKTDEPNYQSVPELVDQLVGKYYYITEKCDGSSTTAYRYKGQFGVCSRNLELERNEENGYWKMALKYDLENKLPEGYALQWETCGPGIQGNPMGLTEISAFAFSGYNINEHRYLHMDEFFALLHALKFPMCKLIDTGKHFERQGLELLGEGSYANGSVREGVVIRSQSNYGHALISFKVINLDYKD